MKTQMKRKMRISKLGIIPVAFVGVLAGCGGEEISTTVPGVNPPTPTAINITPNADAGVPVQPVNDPKTLYDLFVVNKVFGARSDPFALLAVERKYEAEQLAQNLQIQGGNWPMLADPRPLTPPAPPVQFEPQPYRRLAGILIGDTITALLDMGDGRGMMTIRPGTRVPPDWIVASIDATKAVLRRADPRSIKRPLEVVVRLESPPPGVGTAPAQNPAPNPDGDPANPTTPPGFEFDDR